MLKKKNKLSKKKFDFVFKNGENYHSNFLYLKKIVTNKNLEVSFVAPTKLFKKAVERNKIKRQGYNLFKKNQPNIKEGGSLIFFIKKEIPSLKIYEEEINYLLKKAKLL